MEAARIRPIEQLEREEGSGVRRRPRPPQPPAIAAPESSDEASLSALVASVAPPPMPEHEPDLWLGPTMPPPTIDPLVTDVDDEAPVLLPMRFSLAPRRAARRSRRRPLGLRIAAGLGAVALGVGVAALSMPASTQVTADQSDVTAPPLTQSAPVAQATPRGPALELQDVSADFDPSALLATVAPTEVQPTAPATIRGALAATTEPEPSEAPAPAMEVSEADAPEAMVAEPVAVEEIAPTTSAAPAAVVEGPPTRERNGSVLDLVDRALGHGAQPAPAPVAAAPAAPEPSTPDREEVRTAMEGVRGAIEACAAGERGVVQLQLQVGSSGRVRSARVTGDFAGTPQGSCMARAGRGASFPAFEAEQFAVRYPFRL